MAKKKKAEPVSELQKSIEEFYEAPPQNLPEEAEARFLELRRKLATGEIRAAQIGPHGWEVNAWVKKGILLGFRLGRMEDVSLDPRFRFFDNETFPLKSLEVEDGVRVVPGGSSIREGAYLARGVVCMPPMFVNVGAHVGEATLIDSHVLVGFCAQVGSHVHLSAGTLIGGALEPTNALPAIIEDDVYVGAGSMVAEGILIRKGAVLAAGTILTRYTPVYDVVNEVVLRAKPDKPLAIPRGAVVVSGSRPAKGELASREGLALYAPIIVKYRNPGSPVSDALEAACS